MENGIKSRTILKRLEENGFGSLTFIGEKLQVSCGSRLTLTGYCMERNDLVLKPPLDLSLCPLVTNPELLDHDQLQRCMSNWPMSESQGGGFSFVLSSWRPCSIMSKRCMASLCDVTQGIISYKLFSDYFFCSHGHPRLKKTVRMPYMYNIRTQPT